MQGGKNHVAGERRLDGNISGFHVPDFPHQHNVWILTEKRT